MKDFKQEYIKKAEEILRHADNIAEATEHTAQALYQLHIDGVEIETLRAFAKGYETASKIFQRERLKK